MKAYAMTTPPAMLTSQLSKYVATRTAVFDARRVLSTNRRLRRLASPHAMMRI